VSDIPALKLETTAPDRIVLSGALSFADAAQALVQLRTTLRGRANVSVDLSGVERADSAGLAVLLAVAGDARRDKQLLRFESAPEGLLALAQLCEVENLLGFAPEPARI
jgi:phospholipid transport system transporter-binding protein